MIPLKKEVIAYLKSEPKFRERSNKDRGIVNLLMRRYGTLRAVIEAETIRKETIISIVQDYASMNRAWRKVLEEDETLRGRDYGDKERLEQEHQVALGYVPQASPPPFLKD